MKGIKFISQKRKKKSYSYKGEEEEGADRALPDRIVVLKVWHPAGGDAAARRRRLPMPKGGAKRQMLAREKKALKRKAKSGIRPRNTQKAAGARS